MVSTNITKIFFRGNEIVALYKGDTLIFKKSSGGGSTTKPTGVYKIKGTVTESSGYTQFNLTYNNGQMVNVKVNKDLTFETDLQEPLTNAKALFKGRSYLETLDLNSLDTSQVTDMADMFSQSNYLKDIKLSSFDTSIVTNMSGMFYSCYQLETLDLSNFDTSNVMTMDGMFNGCYSLKTLDLSNFNTINVKSARQMISFCYKLKTVDASNFDTKNLSDFNMMFSNCDELTTLYANIDFSKAYDDLNLFYSDDHLTNIVGRFSNIKQSFFIDSSPNLTVDSLMVIINGLATVTETRRLTLSRTSYDSLTNEQIAIATSKGWTVIRN